MEMIIVQVLFGIACVCALASCLIPKRADGADYRWRPSRGFAKIKKGFEALGMRKPMASFMTEIVSGILHAPFAFLFVHDFVTQDLPTARWAAAAVFIFWLGFGFGRATLIENQMKRGASKTGR